MDRKMGKLQLSEKPRRGRICEFPVRYVVTFLGFWGLLNVYAMRVNLSVALVAMVNHTAYGSAENHNDTECPAAEMEQQTEYVKGGLYNWDSKTQGIILGSFFYGYIITQLPGGYLAEKFGAKWLFGGGVLVTAVLSLLTPLAAAWGTVPFVAIRVLEGFGEGVTFPSVNALISKWSPKFERSRLSTIVYTGSQIGNVIAMPVSGLLCASDVLGGWPSVFYVFGALSCFWFLLWCAFVYDSPAEHPRISQDELLFILEDQELRTHKSPPVPWKHILTSVPVWALTLTHFGQNFGFLMLLTELPTYLSSILHFNIQADGVLSALPYLVQAISAWIASVAADRIRETGRLQNTTIRKIFNTIGFFGPAFCLVAVAASGCRPTLIVGLISLALAFNGLIYSGFNVTHVDMSPDFAGTLFGITNTAANLCGILAPYVVGTFTEDENTMKNWNKVFYITAAIYVVTAIIYIVFATAELQPWGLASENETTKDMKRKERPDAAIETKR